MIPANQILLKSSSFVPVETMWRMVDCLYGGTETMREAGREYLPQASRELDADYANRLTHSVLANFYKQAVISSNDLVYNNGIQVSSSTPTVDQFFTDVNAKGDNLETFMREAGKSAIQYGISYLFTDYTRGYDETPTEYDRPYWCIVEAPDMIAIESRLVNGVETICHVRFRETIVKKYTTPSGLTNSATTSFGVEEVSQVKCYYLNTEDPDYHYVTYEIYQPNVNGDQWAVVREGIVEGVIRIPMVPYYGNKTGFYIGRPLYSDLAELNVRHWQSYSDQTNLLHYARFPILFANGIDDVGPDGKPVEIQIGANTVLRTSNPNADMKFVEHTGAAVDSGQVDLDKLQEYMTIFGPTLAVNAGGNGSTATEWVLRASALNTTLKSLAENAMNALNHLMSFTVPYLSEAVMPVFLIEPRVLDIPSNTSTQPASAPNRTVDNIANNGSDLLATTATASEYL
jgi:hypothetical protein